MKPIISKIKYQYPILYFLILSIPIAFVSILDIESLYTLDKKTVTLNMVQISFFVFLPFFVALYKLRSLKSIEIREKKIIIDYPFIFKLKEYSISQIININVEKIKPEGSGPGLIEFPYNKVTIVFIDTSISITSKTNTNIDGVINFLEK